MGSELHVDPSAVREKLAAAIARYEDTIEELKADVPEFPDHVVGVGFAEQGRALAQGLKEIQKLNVSFLQTRVAGWREVMRLMDSISETDQLGASELRVR